MIFTGFISPELKAENRLSVTFSQFHLLLQNHRANFNQTWHKAFLSEWIQVCPNEGPCPCPIGDNYEIAKINTLTNKKTNLLLLNRCANFNQTWQKACMFGWRGLKFVQIEEPRLFSKGRWYQNCKNTFTKFENLVGQFHDIYNHSFAQIYSLIWTGFSGERCGPRPLVRFFFIR